MHCLHSQTAGYLLGLIIDPDDGGSTLFRNAGVYQTTRRHIPESSTRQCYNYYKIIFFDEFGFLQDVTNPSTSQVPHKFYYWNLQTLRFVGYTTTLTVFRLYCVGC
jgi:hypothetical protein